MDNQQGPTVYHKELCSIFCNGLIGKIKKNRYVLCVLKINDKLKKKKKPVGLSQNSQIEIHEILFPSYSIIVVFPIKAHLNKSSC